VLCNFKWLTVLCYDTVFTNGERFTLSDENITVKASKLTLYCNVDSGLLQVGAVGASECRADFKESSVLATNESAYLFDNYGIKNSDSVYYENISALDTQFGNFLTESDNFLKTENFFSGKTKNYQKLDELPKLSKVRIFDGDKEIFALKTGELSISREIPADLVIFIARFDKNNLLKEISHEKTAIMDINEEDSVKVFVIDSKSNIKPVYVAAEITSDGIFFNDGYEHKEGSN